MSLSFSEPITFLTDLLITTACIIFIGLIRKKAPSPPSIHPWQWFFATLGLASFLGGVGHLLFLYIGPNLLLASWLLSGFAIFIFERISISLISRQVLRTGLTIFISCKFIAFVIFSLVYRSFTGVKVHAALGLLLIVLAIHTANFIRSRSSGSVWIIIGIFLMALSALIHSLRLALDDKWFNHNDLGHVIVLAGLFAIYKGARYFLGSTSQFGSNKL
jgi:hypothetical protein